MAEREATEAGQFGGLTERQQAVGVERGREHLAQTLFCLCFRDTEALRNGIRNLQRDFHCLLWAR
jgi:hypothetical protein